MRQAVNLFVAPDKQTAAAVERAIPGTVTILADQEQALDALKRVGKQVRPVFVGYVATPAHVGQPHQGAVLQRGADWVVRWTDLPRLNELPRVAAVPVSRNVVFQRRGAGLGDVVSMLGSMAAWKRDHPGDVLHLDSVAPIASIAENHPAVDVIHTTPQTVPEQALVLPCGLPQPPDVERDRDARRTLNRTEMFAAMAGVRTPEIPRVYLTAAELAWAAEWLARERMPAPVVLVWRCRNRYKDYVHAARLYHRLRLGSEVLILEHELDVPGPSTKWMTIRQQAAIIAHARLVVTPDTGWLHVAGALRKPIFGLYGSQNGALRQAAYEVPGGWMQGPCHLGRQPCIEETCKGRDNYQPCLMYSAAAAEAMIWETLAALPA